MRYLFILLFLTACGTYPPKDKSSNCYMQTQKFGNCEPGYRMVGFESEGNSYYLLTCCEE